MHFQIHLKLWIITTLFQLTFKRNKTMTGPMMRQSSLCKSHSLDLFSIYIREIFNIGSLL